MAAAQFGAPPRQFEQARCVSVGCSDPAKWCEAPAEGVVLYWCDKHYQSPSARESRPSQEYLDQMRASVERDEAGECRVRIGWLFHGVWRDSILPLRQALGFSRGLSQLLEIFTARSPYANDLTAERTHRQLEALLEAHTNAVLDRVRADADKQFLEAIGCTCTMQTLMAFGCKCVGK